MTNRLAERFKYLKGRPFEDDAMIREFDSLCHVMECETLSTYRFAMEFAKKNGINRIFDIGCAYGHQSEVFLHSGVDYVGINNNDLMEFWNRDQFKYLVGEYPVKLDTTPSDMAVSVLCLTWNCYLYEGEKTLKEQCEALARDFNHVLLYMPKDNVEFVSRYFDSYEILGDMLVYFSKREDKNNL